MGGLLAGDAHLAGNEVIHGHLPRAGGRCRARNSAGTIVGEVDNRAMAKSKGGEGGGRAGHISEESKVGGGLGKEKVLVGGEGLGWNRDIEVGLN